MRVGGYTLKVVDRISAIPQAAWDALAERYDMPFMSWTFLEALEASGSAAAEVGWWPRHLTLWRGKRLIAAAPAYVKVDSAGDFSRDWGWAELAGRAGVRYYPKLVLGVPFTPVPGRRILVARGEDDHACVSAIMALALEQAEANGLSSLHVLFCDPSEIEPLQSLGFSPRVLVQFHWHNRGYENTDAWLATLKSKKRNQVKRERAEMARRGIELRTVCSDEIAEDSQRWATAVYRFYRSTCNKFFWGRPYLTQAFYHRVFERMPESLEVVAAHRDGRLIAGAFNVRSATRLFGRYWGCNEEHRFLHFNVCVYHSIEECIRQKIQVFEGGMGGNHKLARGFEPVFVHSAHLFLDTRLDEAIGEYCRLEKQSRIQEVTEWLEEKGLR